MGEWPNLVEIGWQFKHIARESAPRSVAVKDRQNMQDISIERAGIPNLDFTGDLIGQSAGPTPVVKIYRTKALKYVGELRADQKLAQAQAFDSPQELVNWFKTFNYGTINPDVQDAIEAATKNDEPFKAAWNVQVA